VVWASEDPRPWESESEEDGGLPGVNEVVAAGVQGLVLYLAFPSSVNADGTLTQKGRDLAGNLTTAAMVKANAEPGMPRGAAAARRRATSTRGGLLPSPEQVECVEGDYGELGYG